MREPPHSFAGWSGLAFLQSLENTRDGVATGLQLGDNVLDGRLEQGDHIGDEFVLGFDADQLFQVLFANIEALLNISAFQDGLRDVLVASAIILDQLGRGVVGVRKHDGGFTLDDGEELGIIETRFLHSLDQEGVLDHFQLDLTAEGKTAQLARLNGVETSDIGDVKMRISLNLLAQAVDQLVFQFFFHNESLTTLEITRKRIWCRL